MGETRPPADAVVEQLRLRLCRRGENTFAMGLCFVSADLTTRSVGESKTSVVALAAVERAIPDKRSQAADGQADTLPLLHPLTSITFIVGLLRIAPAARAVAVAPTRPLLLVVALTKADGLTNASTSAKPKKTSAAAANTLMPCIVLCDTQP